MNYLYIVLVSVAAGWALTKAAILLARALGVVDQPASHKIHQAATPRLGGIGIVSGSLAGIAIAWRLGMVSDPRIAVFVLGGVAMAGLGFIDDLFCLKATHKLAGQILIAAGVSVAATCIGPRSHSSILWSVGAAALIVGGANAMNLTDGMDGLAAGTAMVASLAYGSILVNAGNIAWAAVALALFGACAGFIKLNWHPAKTFMGDCGSLFLGYWLAVLMISSFEESGTRIGYAACLVIVGLPVLDTGLSIVRRLIARRPLFSPDKQHIYNVLSERFSLRHPTAVLVVCLTAALFAVTGVFAFTAPSAQATATLISLCLFAALAVGKLKLFRMEV
jgi:UDP-GlcNAc:undecaprenyl-phosphate/decaprenyl-phosphate GlcNAc-1-phosphate transferase